MTIPKYIERTKNTTTTMKMCDVWYFACFRFCCIEPQMAPFFIFAHPWRKRNKSILVLNFSRKIGTESECFKKYKTL